MKMLIVLAVCFLVVGCGVPARETGSTGSSSGGTVTPAPEEPTYTPAPHTDNGYTIVFTEPTGNCYISEIWYGGVMTEKIVVTVKPECPSNRITFYVNGAYKGINITGAGEYICYTRNGTDTAREIYLGIYTLPLDKVSGNFVELRNDVEVVERHELGYF
jgi:hypothetical protein